MEVALLIVSILLIIIVLLQSSKAEGGAQIISGAQSELFANRKERGSELSWCLMPKRNAAKLPALLRKNLLSPI